MAYYEDAIGEAINLGTSHEIKIRDLAEWINELTGNDAGIVFRERRDWDKKTSLLASIEKAKKLIGYEPTMNFKDGLKHTHAWFTENWQNIQKSSDISNIIVNKC
jgi:nucleoside-diphosphate-sugar epimerase